MLLQVKNRSNIATNHLAIQKAPIAKELATDVALDGDRQGVYALSKIAEGEQVLREIFEKVNTNSKVSGQENSLYKSATDQIQKIVDKIPQGQTSLAVSQNLTDALDVFKVKTKDLALREHLNHCQMQAAQRRKDVALSLAGLAKTLRNAPDQGLREEASALANKQVLNLGKAEQAMSFALSRYKADSATSVQS